MAIAAIVFAVAALGGATMAAMRLQGRALPPVWLALLHGTLAAAGLALLIHNIIKFLTPATAMVALAGFILAALGGSALLLGYHARKKPLPVAIILAHGGVAVISYIILLVALF